jgi:hypothetical protein
LDTTAKKEIPKMRIKTSIKDKNRPADSITH